MRRSGYRAAPPCRYPQPVALATAPASPSPSRRAPRRRRDERPHLPRLITQNRFYLHVLRVPTGTRTQTGRILRTYGVAYPVSRLYRSHTIDLPSTAAFNVHSDVDRQNAAVMSTPAATIISNMLNTKNTAALLG